MGWRPNFGDQVGVSRRFFLKGIFVFFRLDELSLRLGILQKFRVGQALFSDLMRLGLRVRFFRFFDFDFAIALRIFGNF